MTGRRDGNVMCQNDAQRVEHDGRRADQVADDVVPGERRTEQEPQWLGGVQRDAGQLEELEREAMIEALDRHQGRVADAGRDLGLSRATMYRRIRHYRIERAS